MLRFILKVRKYKTNGEGCDSKESKIKFADNKTTKSTYFIEKEKI